MSPKTHTDLFSNTLLSRFVDTAVLPWTYTTAGTHNVKTPKTKYMAMPVGIHRPTLQVKNLDALNNLATLSLLYTIDECEP